MRIAVATPTRLRGGLDVNSESLNNQVWPEEEPLDLVWLVADEFYEERADEVQERAKELSFEIQHFRPKPKRPNMWNNFATAYNECIVRAREWDADLFVSMQDYFWIPAEGLLRYAIMAEQMPKAIYTGFASLSADPYPEEVGDLKGGWTIFKKPWEYKKPVDIIMHDPRIDLGPMNAYLRITEITWELNWAAWPRYVLESGIMFDHDFEAGVAYDNQYFAFLCERELGVEPFIDPTNHAIGLPHKSYFPEIEKIELDKNNQALYEHKVLDYDAADLLNA